MKEQQETIKQLIIKQNYSSTINIMSSVHNLIIIYVQWL